MLLLIVWYMAKRTGRERRSMEALREATEAGMLEPPTLHPLIDPVKCIGCGSCVAACPEQGSHPVLGMIGNKARLIGPSDCIGHGACKSACPAGAITLVFGTESRGVDIPVVQPNFETNVPGIFIAGELGGMGLIRNAIEQGRQAVGSIKACLDEPHDCDYDLVIVGAGPAGFCASLAAMELGLRYVTLEQETLGGTVAHFPRRKLVMTQPAQLPLVGKVRFKEVRKEQLIDFWTSVEQKTGVIINCSERVDGITAGPGGIGHIVKSNRRSYHARTVLLAIGRRGTPRKLNVPGEDLPKVTYRLIDPDQHNGQAVLVVGGGDSALEAATSIAAGGRANVTLSYRSAAFSRAKPKNRSKIDSMMETGQISVLFNSTVREICDDRVDLDVEGQRQQLANDAVIITAGGILPTGFLRDIGVSIETKHGTE
ncbi:MAG: NAD(P)-binding domain-containing protein [Gammaproteobacteria bacterium]|nr:NAD(P)-binding domain-containing protein [Gammaproteobacteria bacterium]